MDQIKSNYSVNELFSFMTIDKCLKIIKNAKKIQKTLNITIDDYRIYYFLKKEINLFKNICIYFDYLCSVFKEIDKGKLKRLFFLFLVTYTRKNKYINVNIDHDLSSELILQNNIENISLEINSDKCLSKNIFLKDAKNIVEQTINFLNLSLNEEIIINLFEKIVSDNVLKLHIINLNYDNQKCKLLFMKYLSNLNPNIEELDINDKLIISNNNEIDNILIQYKKLKKINLFVPLAKIKIWFIKKLFRQFENISEINLKFDILNYSTFDTLVEDHKKQNIKKISLDGINFDTNETHFSKFTNLEVIKLKRIKEPFYINLSNNYKLKVLKLDKINITSDILIKTLINNIESLESLSINFGTLRTIESSLDVVNIINILIQLKKLVIKCNLCTIIPNMCEKYSICLNSLENPNIETIKLDLYDIFNMEKMFKAMPKLNKISLFLNKQTTSTTINQFIPIYFPLNTDNLTSISIIDISNSFSIDEQYLNSQTFTFKNLENLYLSFMYNEQSCKLIEKILGNGRKRIKKFYFDGKKQEKEHFFPLIFNVLKKTIPNLEFLESFSFSSNFLTDDAYIILLKQLESCKYLEYIKIEKKGPIGGEVLEQINKSKKQWKYLKIASFG